MENLDLIRRDPLPEEDVDLSGTNLNEYQKAWIVDEIKSRRSSAKILATKYNLKRNSLTQLVSRHKKGHCFVSGTGRPKCLDDWSLERGEQKLLLEEYDKSDVGDVVDEVISTEFQNTFARRRYDEYLIMIADEHYPKMSKTSRYRYRKYFGDILATIDV